MRPRACIVLALAAVGAGCAHIPDRVRVDIDGHAIEVVKTAPAPVAPPEPDDER